MTNYKFPSLIKFFKSFTKVEAIYMTFVVVLAVGMAVFFPELMLESTASPLLIICSVMNVIASRPSRIRCSGPRCCRP